MKVQRKGGGLELEEVQQLKDEQGKENREQKGGHGRGREEKEVRETCKGEQRIKTEKRIKKKGGGAQW